MIDNMIETFGAQSLSKLLTVNTTLPRHERPQDLARQYAEHIERMAREYPYQWFNFYDFWG